MLKKTLLILPICAAVLLSISQLAYAQIGEFKITATGAAQGDLFGRSVSIDGDYAVVGALGDDDNGTHAGSAYIFKRNGRSWVQEAKLLATGGGAADRFGWSVSISDNEAVGDAGQQCAQQHAPDLAQLHASQGERAHNERDRLHAGVAAQAGDHGHEDRQHRRPLDRALEGVDDRRRREDGAERDQPPAKSR